MYLWFNFDPLLLSIVALMGYVVTSGFYNYKEEEWESRQP
jgi:hypothetical protein